MNMSQEHKKSLFDFLSCLSVYQRVNQARLWPLLLLFVPLLLTSSTPKTFPLKWKRHNILLGKDKSEFSYSSHGKHDKRLNFHLLSATSLCESILGEIGQFVDATLPFFPWESLSLTELNLAEQMNVNSRLDKFQVNII